MTTADKLRVPIVNGLNGECIGALFRAEGLPPETEDRKKLEDGHNILVGGKVVKVIGVVNVDPCRGHYLVVARPLYSDERGHKLSELDARASEY